MQSQVLPQLLKAASTSTMGSKHAAAIMYGKRLLAIDTNCSLPAGQLVDVAATVIAAERATSSHSRRHSFSKCTSSNTHKQHKQTVKLHTPFNQLYQRYQGFEKSCVRHQSRQNIYQQSINRTRCEKHSQAQEDYQAYGTCISSSCRGECLGAL